MVRRAGPLCLVAAVAAAGCSNVLGLEDPVAAHEVRPQLAGRYLLTIDAASRADGLTYRFLVDVEVDVDARELDTTWQALRAGATTQGDVVGAAQTVEDVFLDNALELGFEETLSLDIDAAAATDGVAVDVDGTVLGKFPALGDVATTDAFCGVIEAVVTPPEQPLTLPFAAVKVEVGTTLPMTPPTSCDDI